MTKVHFVQKIVSVRTQVIVAVNRNVIMGVYAWWVLRRQEMFVITNMNVRVDVARKENVGRPKINAL